MKWDGEKFNHWLKEHPLLASAICVSLALLLCAGSIGETVVRVKKLTSQSVMVTGAASQEVASDKVVWTCQVEATGATRAEAYQRLRDSMTTLRGYLKDHQVPDSEINEKFLDTVTLYKQLPNGVTSNEISGYRLQQTLEVTSTRVDAITALSRESNALLEKGLSFTSDPPQYFYTKLEDLKVEMIAQATQNAKQRAQSLARGSGSRVSGITSANTGVFQITPVDSTEVSDYGINDTSSLRKKITAVVNVSFALE